MLKILFWNAVLSVFQVVQSSHFHGKHSSSFFRSSFMS